jgi:4-amino-4-deoxy-L-arabinose transferase-like glycosyltransferase
LINASLKIMLREIARRPAALIIVLILGGSALRLIGLFNDPFWLDEGYSREAVGRGLDYIWNVVPKFEAHPPLYYTLLWTWSRIAGTSIEGLRLLGAFASAGTLFVIALAARSLARLTNQPVHWVTAAAVGFAALSPEFFAMAQEVRTYPVLILAFAVGIAAVLWLAEGYRADKSLRLPPFALYILSITALPWLHNMGILFAFCLGLALVLLTAGVRLRWSRRDWAVMIVGHIVFGLAYLPAFAMMRDQSAAWADSTWLTFSASAVPDSLAELYGTGTVLGLVLAFVIALLGWMGWAKQARDEAGALAILTLGPVLLAIGLSIAIAPVFLPRTLAPAGVPLALALALAIVSVRNARLIAVALALVMLMATIVQTQRPPAQNWRGAVAFIKRHAAQGDMVYAYPNDGALPYKFAARDAGLSIDIREIPGGFPSTDPTGLVTTGTRGVLTMPDWRLEQIAGDTMTSKARTIWLLRLGAGFDRRDAFLNALKKRRKTAGRFQDGAIEVIRLVPFERSDYKAGQPGTGPTTR